MQDIKREIEAKLSHRTLSIEIADEDVSLTNEASKILKLCILEARLLKNTVVDTEHVLLALLKDKNNMAADVLEEHDVQYKRCMNNLAFNPISLPDLVLLRTMMKMKKK